MDKINLANWERIFGNHKQEIVFANNRYSEMHIGFDEPGLTSGSIQHVSTPGMQLMELSLNAGQPFQLVDDSINESAESVFGIEGQAESTFQNLCSPLFLQNNYHNLQYNPAFGGKHIITSSRFHVFSLTFHLDFLRDLLQTDDNKSMGQLANSIEKKNTWVANMNAMPWRGSVTDIINAIIRCPFSGLTRYIYLESKMLELFAIQMEQANVDCDYGKKAIYSTGDREKLFAVRQYIDHAYLEDFCLKDLTYKFGLNEFKLKKGFKVLFDTTVFGYVLHLRMQKAKSLLSEKRMNVSEAAFFIGYQNVSSFSTEFKKRFGYRPGLI